jgi:hypothetical protein
MQSRFTIVLMSIAGAAVLFGIGFTVGLGILTTPPASQQQHKQIAVTDQPTKVARQETTGSGKHEDIKPAPGRALTPLIPVAPGGSAAQAEQAKSADAQARSADAQANKSADAQVKSVDASAKAAPQPAQQPQQQQQAKAPAPAVAPAAEAQKPAAKEEPKTQEAKAAPAQAVQAAKHANADAAPATSPKNVTPVSLQGRNACDVSACARAYHSFRESDCTYQPYSGPRQICVGPPGANEASRSHPERAARREVDRRDNVDQRDVDRRDDARVTEGRGRGSDDADADEAAPRRYHRDFTADGEDDRIMVVPADEGRGDAVDAAPDEDDDDQ